MIVYRKELPVGALIGGGTLDFGQPVHDYAQASFHLVSHRHEKQRFEGIRKDVMRSSSGSDEAT